MAPKNDSVRSPKIDTRLVEILHSFIPFVSVMYPLLILHIPTTKLRHHNLKTRTSTINFMIFKLVFVFWRKSCLSLVTRIFCQCDGIYRHIRLRPCGCFISRYHLDLCRNVFGEEVYPDVFMTNLYYGGTRIAGMAFELLSSVLELLATFLYLENSSWKSLKMMRI